MRNNKLISYKENIFTKISNFFKKLLFRKKKFLDIEESDYEKVNYNNQCKEHFIKNIMIEKNEEEIRLKKLQLQYDNGEIDEEDISDEDMDKLIEMYERETEKLNKETENIKIHISQMLKRLKQA